MQMAENEKYRKEPDTFSGGVRIFKAGSHINPVAVVDSNYEADRWIARDEKKDAAAARPSSPDKRAMCQAALIALEAYEAWEADVLLNGDWSGDTPKLTQEQVDRMIEIQARRQRALSDLRSAPWEVVRRD